MTPPNKKSQTRAMAFTPEQVIYTPAEVSQIGIEQVKALSESKHRAAALPIPSVGEYFAPMIPGQLCAIIAQTSHYKSAFIDAWEYGLAQQLMRDGRDDEVIVHVAAEEYIHEQAFLAFAKESDEDAGDLARGEVLDWEKLKDAAVKVGTIPIYRIGASLARAEDMPQLYLSNMIRAIQYLQQGLFDRRLKIAACFFDYLQAFPFDPEIRQTGAGEHQRRLQVRNDVYTLRQAGGLFNCPIIVGVQAKQNLQGSAGPNMLIPGNYDGEESSAIGQRAQRIISLWMPKQTHTVGARLTHGNFTFDVEENVLFVKVGKQQGRLPSGKIWKCRVNFQKNTIAPEGAQGD